MCQANAINKNIKTKCLESTILILYFVIDIILDEIVLCDNLFYTIKVCIFMNVLLVDDEKTFLTLLKKKIFDFCRKHDISVNVTTTTDPYLLLEDERYKHTDIILLDIDMPNISGIDIASRINSMKGTSDRPYIIFVTNRDGLVFEALKKQPYSFVRKSHLDDIKACLLNIYTKLSREESIHIKSGRTIDRIAVKEIVYVEKEKNYIIFHTERGKYRERTTIDEKAVELLPKGFLRPHIGYLVNVKYIDELLPQSLQMTNGVQIPLSKKYRKEVKQSFYEWMVKIK